jgi:hypothetical protein
MELHRIPVWAACGSRLDAIAIPDAVERLIIFADNGTAGVRAAERAVIAHKGAVAEIAVCFPPQPHKDWNDMLKTDSAGSGPNGR